MGSSLTLLDCVGFISKYWFIPGKEKAGSGVGADATAGADGVDEDGIFNMTELLRRQAQWLVEVNDLKAAEEMYWAAKEYVTCVSDVCFVRVCVCVNVVYVVDGSLEDAQSL